MELLSIEDINIIMRQTNYTKEEAEKKLNEHKNDKMKVIAEYLGTPKKEKKKVITENQSRLKNFRTLLNNTKPLKTNLKQS
jgi:hypothetical protein